MLKTAINFSVLLVLVLISSSCYNSKKSSYFNEVQDATILAKADEMQIHVQKYDLLSITISSANSLADVPFNVGNSVKASNLTSSGNRNETSGYLVDVDGNIEINQLGKIKAAGVTKKQLKEAITKILLDKQLLVDPIVIIRHLNFEVTVMGEVGRPSVISVPSEKISLIGALGSAGDITIYGQKENVLLIRESDGKRLIKRLNLNSKDFLQSEYYYLQPNDIVYVEADKNKLATVNRTRLILPTLLSAASFFLIALSYFKR
jgi:polysaccharide export outer membrane protein